MTKEKSISQMESISCGSDTMSLQVRPTKPYEFILLQATVSSGALYHVLTDFEIPSFEYHKNSRFLSYSTMVVDLSFY